MTLSITCAAAEDYDAICRILDEGDAHHRDALPHVFQRPEGSVRSRAYLRSYIEDEHKALLVARLGDALVGTLEMEERANPDSPLFKPKRFALVHGLSVAASARRAGVGTALMNEAKRWAQGRGLMSVQLSVWSFNQEAIAFYEALGYRTIRVSMETDV